MKLEFACYIVNIGGTGLRVREKYLPLGAKEPVTGVCGPKSNILYALVNAGMAIAADNENATMQSQNGEDASAEYSPDEYLEMIKNIQFNDSGNFAY